MNTWTDPDPNRSRRRRGSRFAGRVVALTAAVATLTVATACSGATGQSASQTTMPDEPTTTMVVPTTAPGVPIDAPSGSVTVSAFFLHDGWISKGEARSVTAIDGVDAALTALLDGPTELERAAGLVTAVPRGTRVRSLEVADGVATVDFDRTFETASTQPQVAQVVFTLTQIEGIDAVAFLIDGETNGATGVTPISRATLQRFTPPAVVESPTPGQAVAASFPVTGDAVTSGGTVTYRLEDRAGALVAEGALVQQDDGSGRGPFSGTVITEGFTGEAVLIVPAPAPELDDASLARIPITIQ